MSESTCDYTAKAIDELEVAWGGSFVRARASLGATSFGMNIVNLPPNSGEAYPEHSHRFDGQEEVYYALSGSADLILPDGVVALDPGGAMVRVGPETARWERPDGRPCSPSCSRGTTSPRRRCRSRADGSRARSACSVTRGKSRSTVISLTRGMTAFALGELETAIGEIGRAHELGARFGDRNLEAMALVFKGYLLVMTGEFTEARPSRRGDSVRRERRAPPARHRTRFHWVTSGGFYEIGEIRRRRGDFAAAEEAYRGANKLGHDAQPGLALLRLAQGKVDAPPRQSSACSPLSRSVR